MPISITRDDERRRISVTITDPWSVEEIAVAMDRQISEGIWKYGTLYDLTGSAWVPSEPDVLWLVKRAQQQAALHGVRGAIAVLIDSSSADRALLRQYAEYGETHSHVVVRVFDDRAAADAWLAEQGA
jgi:hypothetical protein